MASAVALLVMIAPAAAVLNAAAPAGAPPGALPGAPAAPPAADAANAAAGAAPVYGDRLADGLAAEPPSAQVSLLVRLRGPAISDVILDYRARFGEQAAWPPAVVESARAAVAERNATLGHQRDTVMGALAFAGISTEVVRDYRYLVNGINLRDVPSPAALVLAANAEVAAVERDQQVHVDLAQSVPLINADDVWNLTDLQGRNITGVGSVIANIDTGVDYTHPDLGGTLNRTNDLANLTGGTHTKFLPGWDFVNNDNDPWDDHFHGTHVAGIIGANGTVKGVAPGVKELPLKVLSAAGYGSDSDIIAAMQYATDPDGNALTNDAANASSMSLGGWDPNPDGLEPLAADQSTRLGTICVIAAGNDGATNSIGSPGVSRLSITVGSTTKADALSSFSSRGPTLGLDLKPDLVAPGSSIVSTKNGGAGGTLTLSGTSMATPHVSGAIALILQAHRNWTVNQTKSALVDHAVDLGLGVFEQGGGRLDVLAAVDASALATPHKVVMGRLPRLADATNASVAIENVAAYNVTLNLSVKDVFGMNPDMTATGSTADLDYVSVSPSNVTLSPGGRASVTLTFAPSSSALPGIYWGTLTGAGGNATIRVPISYAVRAPVLLVDDDSSDRYIFAPAWDNYAGFPSATNNMSASLARLGVKHDIFTAVHYTDDGAPLAEMLNYPLVIWMTGYDYDYSDGYHTHHTVSSNDRVALASYLDRGGQLWLIGENIAWDVFGHANTTVASSNFFNAYLGVARVDNELNTPNPLKGTPGTFMAGASYAVNPTWTDYGNRGDYATNLTPTSRAFTLFNASTTDVYGKTYANASLAVAVDNLTYRSVFWGAEFSFLSTNANFDDAVSRTMAFFGPRVALDNATAAEGQNLSLRGSYAFLPNQAAFTVAWDFGDGGTASTRNATHTYLDEGNYTVRFRVTSGAWLNLTGALSLTVLNVAPSVDAANATPLQPFEGDVVDFSSACSDPGALDTISYAWNFGDGGTNASGANLTHVYADEGNYTVLAICSDNDGGTTVYNFTLAVQNAPPNISGVSFGGLLYESMPVNLIGACTDPGPSDTVTFSWSFGDGTANATGASPTHIFADDGNYTVVLTCTDNDGASSSHGWPITILNIAPTAGILGNATVAEGTPLALAANVSDPGVRDTFTYAWDFGDGTAASGAAAPAHAWGDNGVYTVRLSVTDNGGGVGLATLVVTVTNLPPVVVFTIRGNFTEGSPFEYDLNVTDPGWNDTVGFTLNTGDAVTPWGVWANDGSFAISVVAFDDDGASASSLWSVTIANLPPSIAPPTPAPSGFEGEAVPLNVDVSDPGPWDVLNVTFEVGDGSAPQHLQVRDWRSDPTARLAHVFARAGNYTVHVTVDDGDGGLVEANYTVVVANAAPTLDVFPGNATYPEGSTVIFRSGARDAGPFDTFSVEWLFSDNATPVAGPNITRAFRNDGTYTYRVTATDDAGASFSQVFTLTVENAPPVLRVFGSTTPTQWLATDYTATASDPGPDDRVAVAWDWGDGTASSGRDVNHTFARPGHFDVTVIASDGDGGETRVVLGVEVANAVPVIREIGFAGVPTEGSDLTFSADIENPAGEELVFAWFFGDSGSSAKAAPTHAYADDGDYTITLTLTEPDGAHVTTTRPLHILNAPPRIECPACPTKVGLGSTAFFPVVVTDPGAHDLLTFNLTRADGTVVRLVNGSFSETFAALGNAVLQLRVDDGDGGTAVFNITVEVLPDFDHDGLYDQIDPDDDNDGVPDAQDPAPHDPNVRDAGVAGSLLWLLLVVGAVALVFVALRRTRRRGGDD